jgi:hypothetical protein
MLENFPLLFTYMHLRHISLGFCFSPTHFPEPHLAEDFVFESSLWNARSYVTKHFVLQGLLSCKCLPFKCPPSAFESGICSSEPDRILLL